MSVRLMTLVWERFPLGGSDMLAMLALADFANDEGGQLYPSIATVATKCRLSEKQARRVLHALIAEGWLEVVGMADGGASSRQYRIRVERLRQLDLPGVATPPADGTPPTGGRAPTEGSRPLPPAGGDPSHRREPNHHLTVIEPSGVRGAAPDASPVDNSADLETARWMRQKSEAVAPGMREPALERWAETIRLMRERDGLADERIRAVFSWALRDPFWRGLVLSPGKLREKWDELVGQMSRGRRPAASAEWQRSPSALEAKAREIGVVPRPGESHEALRVRVAAALEQAA